MPVFEKVIAITHGVVEIIKEDLIMDNVERIYQRLIAAGMTPAGAAGTIGNLEAESALRANNLQDTYNTTLGMTDEAYTAAVDCGSYTNFQRDCAGYGLAQWTFWTRKRDLLDFARSRGVSVGDPDMQADFIVYEMKRDFVSLWKTLTTTNDVAAASNAVLTIYERPANMGASVQAYRAGLGRKWYDQLAGKSVQKPQETAPSAGNSCTVTLPLLAKGNSGEAVRAVQDLLDARGYSCGVDGRGSFGGDTRTAVLKYQQMHELEDDGVIGTSTWTSLLTRR